MVRQEFLTPLTHAAVAPPQRTTRPRTVLLSLALALVLLGRPVAAEGPGQSPSSPGAACSDDVVGTTQRLTASLETFNKVVGLLEQVTKQPLDPQIKIPLTLAPALLKDLDMARAQGGHLNPLTSHTLERLGTFGLKTLPTVVERLKETGHLPASFPSLPTTFGIDEFVAGAASQVGRQRLGVEEITHYLDGVSKATAAVAGALVAGPQGAKLGESAAGVAQNVFRGLTMPLFQEMAQRPVRQQMIANWQALQESKLARGQAVQRFSELYPLTELQQVGFDANTIADLDRYAGWANASHGGTNLTVALPPRQVPTAPGPRFLIDIPGVNWTGGPREHDWGTLLQPNKVTIYIRHQGPGRDAWDAPKEADARIVILPHRWDEQSAKTLLRPELQRAFAQGKDVHIVVDKNITLSRHMLPLPKPGEDVWAAQVTDYITSHRTAAYHGMLAEHSRGTVTNRYITDFTAFDTVIVASPRGDDALSWIHRTHQRQQIYVITGLSDAPSWRWQERLGDLQRDPRVRIVQLQDLAGPVTTHARLQEVGAPHTWHILTARGTHEFKGSLGDLVRGASPISTTRPGGICLGGPQTYAVNPTLHEEIDQLAHDAAAADAAPQAPRQP